MHVSAVVLSDAFVFLRMTGLVFSGGVQALSPSWIYRGNFMAIPVQSLRRGCLFPGASKQSS
jgi:hypothetical protein